MRACNGRVRALPASVAVRQGVRGGERATALASEGAKEQPSEGAKEQPSRTPAAPPQSTRDRQLRIRGAGGGGRGGGGTWALTRERPSGSGVRPSISPRRTCTDKRACEQGHASTRSPNTPEPASLRVFQSPCACSRQLVCVCACVCVYARIFVCLCVCLRASVCGGGEHAKQV